MFNILHMYILYCLDVRKAKESLFVMYYSVIPELKTCLTTMAAVAAVNFTVSTTNSIQYLHCPTEPEL